MNWSKHWFQPEAIPKFYTDYIAVIKKGEAKLDHCYCAWQYQEDSITYLYSLFDFIDNYKQITENKSLSKLCFYQQK